MLLKHYSLRITRANDFSRILEPTYHFEGSHVSMFSSRAEWSCVVPRGWRLFYKLRVLQAVLACAVLHCPTLPTIPEKLWILQEKQMLVIQVENE
jgi:hypothetical protein